MNHRGWNVSALAFSLALGAVPAFADAPSKPAGPPRKILVELFTTTGSCEGSAGSDWIGKLGRSGYGTDRLVVLNFRLGDPDTPRRRRDLETRLGRFDRGNSPVIIVDGRPALVRPDQASTMTSLAVEAPEPAAVSVDLALSGEGPRRSLAVRLAGRSPTVEGRELIVGMAVIEDPVATGMTSAEVAGQAPVDRQVVRRFDRQILRLNGPAPRTLAFPVELVSGQRTDRTRLAAFVQDRLEGTVYQAESIPWPAAEPSDKLAHRKPRPRRQANPDWFIPAGFAFLPPSSSEPDESADCPGCNSPLSPEFLDSLPPGFDARFLFQFPSIPLPKC